MKISNVLIVCFFCAFSLTTTGYAAEYLLSDGNKIVLKDKGCTNCPNATISLVSTDGKTIQKFPDKGNAMTFSHELTSDEKYLITSGTDQEGMLRVYDVKKNKIIFEVLPFGNSRTWGAVYLLNNNKFAVFSSGNMSRYKPEPKPTAVIYSIDNGVVNEQKRLTNFSKKYYDIASSIDGKSIFFLGSNFLSIFDNSYKHIKDIYFDEKNFISDFAIDGHGILIILKSNMQAFIVKINNENIQIADMDEENSKIIKFFAENEMKNSTGPSMKFDKTNKKSLIVNYIWGKIITIATIDMDKIIYKNLAADMKSDTLNLKLCKYNDNGKKIDIIGMKLTNGSYTGEVIDNIFNGKGTLTWDNGDRYEGDWVNGKRTGKGTYFISDGRKYEGDFLEDKFTGNGKWTFANGTTQEGIYVNGSFISTEKAICITAKVPNPSPQPEETTEFYGDCNDGNGTTGIVIWKQYGEKSTISFLSNGQYNDSIGFLNDKEQAVFNSYIKQIPAFCKTVLDGGEYQGECNNGIPDGVGLWKKTERDSYPGSFIRYYGQFKAGQFNGYGRWKNNYNCGFAGCTKSTVQNGLWKNGVFESEANSYEEYNKILAQRRDAEIKDKYVKENTPRWEAERKELSQLTDKFKCEEAASFSGKHNDNPLIYFNEQSCKDERNFKNILAGKNPQQLYIAASKYEANGERSRAKDIYLSIMDRFSDHALAIKASDRLTAIRDVESVEASNRNAAEVIKRSNEKAGERVSEAASRASRDARDLQKKVCEDQRSACFSSCSGGDSSCYSGCPSCSF